MKCKKLISGVLMSVVMLTSGIMPYMHSGLTANAADVVQGTSTVTLSIKPEKTWFSMDDVKSGKAVTKVRLCVDKLDNADKLTYLEAGFKAENDNVKLSDISVVEKKPGLHNSGRSSAETSARLRYLMYSASENNMSMFIQNDPSNYLVIDKANYSNGIAEFTVTFPSDMPEGTYKIVFSKLSLLSGAELRPGVTPGSDVNPPYGTIITHYSDAAMKNAITAEIKLGGALLGDVSANGKIDLIDAILIAKYIINPKSLSNEQLKVADYNGDNKVDLLDVIGIAKHIVSN